MRVPGTVFTNLHLWIEQFFLVALLGFSIAVASALPAEYDMPAWANEKAKDIHDFCEKLSTMASFMLTFFTSLNVSRWWRLRTLGIGGIWEASSNLTFFLSEWVTRDEHILSSIRRYARTSLMLIFMQERGYSDDLSILVNRGLLTDKEMLLLEQVRYNRSETIWQWVMRIIGALRREGLITSDHMLLQILQIVERGKGGAAVCLAQLATPIPMQYTHFIGFLVKFHNIAVTVLMGAILGGLMRQDTQVMWFAFVWRIVAMPLLYNAILLLNEEIMNPFNGDLMDFPLQKIDRGMEQDGLGYLDAYHNAPDWIQAWNQKDFNPALHRPSVCLDNPVPLPQSEAGGLDPAVELTGIPNGKFRASWPAAGCSLLPHGPCRHEDALANNSVPERPTTWCS